MSLCIAAAGLVVQIAASTFTLAWTHTIEKTVWEEDWRIEGDRLVLVEARIQGSGAGMEPPPEAKLEDGFYVWQPRVPPLPEIIVRRAKQAGDWRLCAAGRCATLAEWLGGAGDPVAITACPIGGLKSIGAGEPSLFATCSTSSASPARPAPPPLLRGTSAPRVRRPC